MCKDALTDRVAKKHYETMHGSRCMTTQKSDITLPRGRPTGNIPPISIYQSGSPQFFITLRTHYSYFNILLKV